MEPTSYSSLRVSVSFTFDALNEFSMPTGTLPASISLVVGGRRIGTGISFPGLTL